MKIGQMARNQNMMYRIISKNSGYASQLPGFGVLNRTKSGTDSMLEKMGLSGLQGRTARDMAKYQMQVQEKSQTVPQSAAGRNAGSLTGQFSVRTQYTPISDEATEAMQKLALQDAANSAGSASSFDSRERVSLIQKQLGSVAPSKRAAAFNTMNKVWESEIDRIGKYIREKEPSWNSWGDSFDTDILKDYKPGVNIWA